MRGNELDRIRALVGEIDAAQLRFVESYVGDRMAIFIPAVGPCYFAITPDHAHPACSFVLNFDRGSRIAAGERMFNPAPGQLLAIDPGARHHEVIEDQHCRYVAIFIDADYFAAQLAPYPAATLLPFDFRSFTPLPELLNLVKDFMAEADNDRPGRELVLAACGQRLCHCLIRSMLELPPVVSEASERLEIHRVIEFLHGHFERKLHIEDLAAVAALSPSHFSRLFRRETGKSPMDYLIALRLAKARKLLRSGSPRITEIALQCGFASSSHLAHSFRKAYGLTPSAYLKSLH